MDNVEQMLEGVLSNPDMMQKIMGLAQSLGTSEKNTPPPQTEPGFNPIKELSGLLKNTGVDAKQQALLKALSPYMHGDRIQKLQRAMQASKIAELASSMLGNSQGR